MKNKLLVLMAAVMMAALTICPFAAGADDDRMAGKVHGTAHRQKQDVAETPSSSPHAAPVSDPVPDDASARNKTASAELENKNHPPEADKTLRVNFTVLESYGLISNAQDGGLGSDLWKGTSRALLAEKISTLPGLAEYRTLQQLVLRAMLTRADASLMKRDATPEAGADLTTLRIEKLLEMGAFDHALALYMKNEDEPYHERLARIGVFAAFYNRQSALACLEEKAMERRFADIPFWQQLAKICSYVLTRDNPASARAVANTIKFQDSKIIQNVIKDDSFRYKATRLEDLQSLTPLEAAVLTGLGRFDFSGMTIRADESLPPHVMAVLIDDPSLGEETSFELFLRALNVGIRSASDLGALYEQKAVEYFGKDKTKTSLAHFVTLNGWRKLPYIHRAALHTTEGPERVAVLRKALALSAEFGHSALWPLADLIAGMDPANLSPEEIRSGYRIIAESAEIVPKSWAKAWRENSPDNLADLNNKQLLAFLAYNLGSGLPIDIERQDSDIKEENSYNLPSLFDHASFAYEKLDKSLKLHNYDASKGYENLEGLTRSVDYVMPYTGLLEDLDKAEYEQRLGEVILLSSVALRDAPPQKLSAEVFGEVIGGLVTVGLTNEARSLAREVLLGLSI